MAYSTLSYSPNEILTSGKMNQASDNDEALRDGTAILNDAILERHILDGEITSAKLVEAFFKGRRQDDNNDSISSFLVNGHRIMFGWSQQVGNGTDDLEVPVTFPQAFSGLPVVICSSAGGLTGTAADIGGMTAVANAPACTVGSVTASGFSARLKRYSATFGNTARWGVAWIAIGPA